MGSTSALLLMELLAQAVELLSHLEVCKHSLKDSSYYKWCIDPYVITRLCAKVYTLVHAVVSNILNQILSNQPSENEPVPTSSRSDNRTGIALGNTTLGRIGSLLTCTANHQQYILMNYSTSSVRVVWVKNGQAVDDTDSRITLNTTTISNQVTSSLSITNFTAGDAGVYQCLFTDDSDGGNTEVITSIPYRLDTGMCTCTPLQHAMLFLKCLGNMILIERVSPEVIFLRPPEKLVIEVRVSGDYEVLSWSKGAANMSIPRLGLHEELANFNETFTRSSTKSAGKGIYFVMPLFKSGGLTSYTLVPNGGVKFAVISPGI